MLRAKAGDSADATLGPRRARRLKAGTGRTVPSLSGGIRYSRPLVTAGSATGWPSITRGPVLWVIFFLNTELKLTSPSAFSPSTATEPGLSVPSALLPPISDRPAHEGVEPVVILLLVAVDQGVVVALAALKIHAQKQPADVAGDEVRIGLAVQQEPRRGTAGGVGSVGRQNLPHQHVIRPVLGESLVQKLAPGAGLHIHLVAALHQHDVEHLLHPPGEARAREQAIDQGLPLVGRGIVEKVAGLGRAGDHAGQVEPRPPQKLSIRGRRSGRLARQLARQAGLDQAVDLLVQGIGLPLARGRPGQQEYHQEARSPGRRLPPPDRPGRVREPPSTRPVENPRLLRHAHDAPWACIHTGRRNVKRLLN